MKLGRLIFSLLLLACCATPVLSFTLSGEITGAEWFGGITYVYALPVDSLLNFNIGLALLGNGLYLILSVPAGEYLLLAYQDRDGNLIPSIDDLMGYYGGQIPQTVQVTGNMSGLDIEVAPLPFTLIAGQVSCSPGQSGLTYVIAATDPLFENVTNFAVPLSLDGNARYSLFVDPGQYYVAAYLDADLSFSRSSEDPQTFYGAPNYPALVDVSGGSAENINLNLLIPPEVILSLTPQGTPIVIPASGGSFNYAISGQNSGSQATTIQIWCDVTLPSGQTYGPVLGPATLNLPAGFSLTRNRTQNVPGSAPAGDYIYGAHFGLYPAIVWVEDSFSFTKLGIGDWEPGAGDWANTGESFGSESGGMRSVPSGQPTEFVLHDASPNPFNPTTVLSFELRAASFVKLEVFDIQGRAVGAHSSAPSSLVNGWREAGAHQMSFDGSAFPSGIYFAKLTAGDYSHVQKMVLMK